MSPPGHIEPPYTLASLPKPLNAAKGRTLVAPVRSLSGSKKRKRTEVVAGIDGEGILIYGLQNPQLITSYALPPDASFTIAPYSLYRKGNKHSRPFRFTYASVIQPTAGERSQIVCYVEESRKDEIQDSQKYSFNLPDSIEHVACIDVLPSTANTSAEPQIPSHDVVIIGENGEALCLSSDLQTVRWNFNLKSLSFGKEGSHSGTDYHVEYTNLISAKAARRGLLKNRDDIAAIIDPSMAEQSDLLDLTQILCVVSRGISKASDAERALELFHILPRSTDLITTHRPNMEHLLSLSLPKPTRQHSEGSATASYSLDSGSGSLHQLINGALVSYDLSSTVPKIRSILNPSGASFQSFAPVSPDLLLTASKDACSLYDVKYSSLRGILQLTGVDSESTGSRKRRHSDLVESRRTMELVTYYADISLIVGVSGHEILGIQVSAAERAGGSLLIDSIGKGVQSKRPKVEHGNQPNFPKPLVKSVPGSITEGSKAWVKWQAKMKKLDGLVLEGELAKFEESFAKDVNIELGPKPEAEGQSQLGSAADNRKISRITGINDGSESVEGIDESEGDGGRRLREWHFPTVFPDSQRQKHRHKALYALSKIFCWTAETKNKQHSIEIHAPGSSIAVKFFPPNVFQWLLLSGYLTKEMIQRALLDAPNENINYQHTISDGDIVKAIVQFDPTMRVLHAILNHPAFFPIGEVVEAVRSLIQSLEGTPEPEPQTKLLTNGTTAVDESDTDFESELQAASQDLDLALSVLDEGISIRSQTLRPALIRLHSFPSQLVSTMLRQTLLHHELVALIRLLYGELKNGGWTSSYYQEDSDDVQAEDSSEDPTDEAVAIIASLLNSTLDAVGTGGWLATTRGSNAGDSTENMIHQLYEEAALALNGFWEARFMRGLLSEFLRYAWKNTRSHKPGNRTLLKQGKPLVIDDSTEGAAEAGLPMLPLGGNGDFGIAPKGAGEGTKVEERSSRHMGMEISKRVPKYSYERIVI